MKLIYIAVALSCSALFSSCTSVFTQSAEDTCSGRILQDSSSTLQNTGYNCECKEAEPIYQGTGVFAEAIQTDRNLGSADVTYSSSIPRSIPLESVITGQPDVTLLVPQLSIKEIDLEVDNLNVGLTLNAAVGNLVSLNAGVDVSVQKVKLNVQGVRAELALVVRLDKINNVIAHALNNLQKNPQLIDLVVNNALPN